MADADSASQDHHSIAPTVFASVGLAMALAAFGLAKVDAIAPLRWICFFAGLLCAGGGVNLRPKSAVILFLGGAATFVASLSLIDPTGIYHGWDSMIILLRVMSAVAWMSAIVVMLPSTAQRVAVSFLVLFHFGGILCAATSAPPGIPWVTHFMHSHVYHGYLHFLYLTNAYQYYAPEPGPATLLWFFVEYESDDPGKRYTRWVKVPYIDENFVERRPDGTRLWPHTEYLRRIALPEGVTPSAMQVPSAEEYDRALRERIKAGSLHDIPMMPGILERLQYAPPVTAIMQRAKSYVQHVANNYKHPDKPDLPVKSVKFYRAVHHLIQPQWIVNGWSPSDPTLLATQYYGTFDKDGAPMPYYVRDRQGRLVPGQDPFRFWMIPIVRTNGEGQVVTLDQKWSPVEDYEIHDYVDRHANIEAIEK